MKYCTAIIFSFLSVLFALPVNAADFYEWRAKNGLLHITNIAPPDNVMKYKKNGNWIDTRKENAQYEIQQPIVAAKATTKAMPKAKKITKKKKTVVTASQKNCIKQNGKCYCESSCPAAVTTATTPARVDVDSNKVESSGGVTVNTK
jgi:hypothetical protein